ncbi:sensor histidine kinase [Streptomyces sp. ISL-10]|uniref:sensor histidine kinase n=1 Tax=Streptomyces sp. ISL-10 TaxID=2819172 RepID=UPI001BE6BF91|nr:sensor histidine kinase [Streptomyces sp. ISL-10]MBT2369338.1 sensor histidine kinase [Streptomyces sp. ISL-10]
MTLVPSGEPGVLMWLAVYLGLCLATVVRRRWPTALCAAVVIATPVHLLLPSLFTYLLPGVCLYALARYGRSRVALALLSGAAVVRLAVARAAMYESDLLAGALLHLASEAGFVAVPLLLGLFTRTRSMALGNLRDKAERLEREQHLLAWRARMEERARLAREMHDVVAHRVSLMVIHAGALEVTAEVPPRAAESARLVGEIGRQALEELRQVLAVLRPEEDEEAAPRAPQPTLNDLPALVEQSRATGMRVDLATSGSRRSLGPSHEPTAYRLVQEALTNVHKHAADAAAQVTVRYEPEALRVIVENDAPSGPVVSRLPSGGHGLTGLRERVTVLGGTFDAGPRGDGGFRVCAVLPTKESAP